MIVRPIKTRVLLPPRDNLFEAVRSSLSSLPEKSILAVTSKVVSIWQGRCVKQSEIRDKDALVKKEADKYLPRGLTPHGWVMHTLKNNLLIPSAGVDESNGNGYYILWPENPSASAKEIWRWLRKTYKTKNFGVLITDSHSIPLRRGVVGISLAHYGFRPLKDYRGTKDLFGRPLVMEQSNIPDALAAATVLAMGEGRESTPLALIEDLPFVKFTPPLRTRAGFTSRPYRSRRPFSAFEVKPAEDIFAPFLKSVPWKI